MNSMATNGVWDLVELPNEARAIGCKQVFKTKKDLVGNVERYKARLVTKGYTKKHGIDYDEVFAPVAPLEIIWLIIAMAPQKK